MVPVRGVELHHREFGVVPNADAFVAEAAVDLEHPLEAADDQALQVQLGRDAQEHLLIQRVVVGDERLGVGAAGDRMQHGRFDFHEAVVDHELPDRRQRLAARGEARARFSVGDQVDVALAVLLLLVGHAVELVGQRTQALGQQTQAGHAHRQLAGLGLEQRAFGAEDVAQIKVLERLVAVFADAVLGDEQLDAPAGGAQRAVLQRAETGLAHHPLEHHAATHAHAQAQRLELFVRALAMRSHEFGRSVRGLEVVGKRHTTLSDRGEFFSALGDELVFVDRTWVGICGVRCVRDGHERVNLWGEGF